MACDQFQSAIHKCVLLTLFCMVFPPKKILLTTLSNLKISDSSYTEKYNHHCAWLLYASFILKTLITFQVEVSLQKSLYYLAVLMLESCVLPWFNWALYLFLAVVAMKLVIRFVSLVIGCYMLPWFDWILSCSLKKHRAGAKLVALKNKLMSDKALLQ